MCFGDVLVFCCLDRFLHTFLFWCCLCVRVCVIRLLFSVWRVLMLFVCCCCGLFNTCCVPLFYVVWCCCLVLKFFVWICVPHYICFYVVCLLVCFFLSNRVSSPSYVFWFLFVFPVVFLCFDVVGVLLLCLCVFVYPFYLFWCCLFVFNV